MGLIHCVLMICRLARDLTGLRINKVQDVFVVSGF
jgi:hypothetical protein